MGEEELKRLLERDTYVDMFRVRLKKEFNMTDEEIDADGRTPFKQVKERDIKRAEQEYFEQHGRTPQEDGVEMYIVY